MNFVKHPFIQSCLLFLVALPYAGASESQVLARLKIDATGFGPEEHQTLYVTHTNHNIDGIIYEDKWSKKKNKQTVLSLKDLEEEAEVFSMAFRTYLKAQLTLDNSKTEGALIIGYRKCYTCRFTPINFYIRLNRSTNTFELSKDKDSKEVYHTLFIKQENTGISNILPDTNFLKLNKEPVDQH